MPGEQAATGKPRSWHGGALAVAAVAALPLLSRTTLTLERVGGVGAVDLRGLLSDLAVSLLVAAVLILVSRLSRILATLLMVPWGLVHYGNFETVSVLGALASVHDIAYLGDSTFFFGSVIAVSNPLLLVGGLALSIGLFWWGAVSASLRSAVLCSLLAAVALLAHFNWPFAAEAARWRQVDVAQQNVELMLASAIRPYETFGKFRDSQTAVLDLMPSMAADLDGEPIVPVGHEKMNVLLVILESVSGGYIRPLAVDHDWHPEADMPQLGRIANSNLAYSSFIAHQRRTNRGVYSLLCGDLPNLLPGLPKMSAYMAGGRICLPEILRRNGYETIYLQAAPLAFMMKERFMPLAGFTEVYGHKWFDQHYARSRWGVDDQAMLEQSVELIQELQQRGKPWFLSLLTVGTHHPYLVPEGFQEGRGTDAQRSFAYLDRAVGAFNKRLNELGVPENTLILYTSDESAGMRTSAITQSWGYMIARVPGGARGHIQEPFGQMDVALSTLDYLGLGDAGPHLFGRSIFRRYAEPRYLFFSNTNMFYAGARDPDGRLLLCTDSFTGCTKFDSGDGKIFSDQHRSLAAKPSEFQIVRRMAQRTIAGRSTESASRRFDMMVDPVFAVEASGEVDNQLIHGGVYVDVDHQEWVEVEIVVEARGAPGAHTIVQHFIRSLETEVIEEWFKELRSGQTLRLRYTYAPSETADGVQCRSIALVRGDLPLELDFKVARQTHHRSGERPAPGIQLLEFETVQSEAGDEPAG